VEPVDILTIAAHPDDVELTCAGTLIRMIQQGYSAGILDLTHGEMGTRGTPELRATEAAAAATVIGARWRERMNLGDSRLTSSIENRFAVAERIRAAKPLLKLLEPLMRPLLEANHRWAMKQGEESLKLELRRARAGSAAERAQIPAPPGPTFRRVPRRRPTLTADG